MEKLLEQINEFFKGKVVVEIVNGYLVITTDSQKTILSMPRILGIDSMGL